MTITVKVKPGAKKAKVEKKEDIFTIWVDAPPVEGKANKKLIKILSEYFKKPKGSFKIVKGVKSKHKMIEIEEFNERN